MVTIKIRSTIESRLHFVALLQKINLIFGSHLHQLAELLILPGFYILIPKLLDLHHIFWVRNVRTIKLFHHKHFCKFNIYIIKCISQFSVLLLQSIWGRGFESRQGQTFWILLWILFQQSFLSFAQKVINTVKFLAKWKTMYVNATISVACSRHLMSAKKEEKSNM